MCLYLDGIVMDKPIDIFESSFGRGTGYGREGKERRKGVSEKGAGDFESYGYGYGGYSFVSPYAVPQEGLLLFASSGIRGMPGGTKLRKAVFRNSILPPKAIEDQYVTSRHKKRPNKIPQSLTLAPIMKKKAWPLEVIEWVAKAVPLWIHGSYVAEFCNPFVPSAGGSPLHLYGIFTMALEAVTEKMADGGLWTSAEVSGCKKVLGLFRTSAFKLSKGSYVAVVVLRRLGSADAQVAPALDLPGSRPAARAVGHLFAPFGLGAGGAATGWPAAGATGHPAAEEPTDADAHRGAQGHWQLSLLGGELEPHGAGAPRRGCGPASEDPLPHGAGVG